MTILALDTTGTACSAALVEREQVIAEVFTNLKRNHSVTLMPMIDDVFTKCGLCVNDIDFIAITTGPGSFTGLRIGAATAKALAHAASKKLVSVPTLDALAYNANIGSQIIVPIMDARRRQVYTAFYRNDKDYPKPISEYMAEDITQVLQMIDGYKEQALFTGDAVHIYSDIIKNAGHEITSPIMRAVRASAVGALAFKLLETSSYPPILDYTALTPFYLRMPQAERELKSKLNDKST